MLKQSQVRMNRAAFSEALMSRQPHELGGLVGHDADGAALDAAEADDDVLRVTGLDFQELVLVEDPGDDLVHVVRLVRRIRDQRVELEILGGQVVLDGALGCRHREVRRVGVVVRRQVAQQVADILEGVLLSGGDVVRGAGLAHMGVGAAQLFLGDVLAGDSLDHVGAGDEHLAGLVDHHDEVGQGGEYT